MPVKNVHKPSDDDVYARLCERKGEMSEYYDNTAGEELPELLPGMPILIQKDDRSSWVPGTVKARCSEPRSYMVQTPNGSVVRRNRRFLKELSTNLADKVSQMLTEPRSDCTNEDVELCNPIERANIVTDDSTDCDSPEMGKERSDPSVDLNVPKRTSTRVKSKPKRFIEECSMVLKF